MRLTPEMGHKSGEYKSGIQLLLFGRMSYRSCNKRLHCLRGFSRH